MNKKIFIIKFVPFIKHVYEYSPRETTHSRSFIKHWRSSLPFEKSSLSISKNMFAWLNWDRTRMVTYLLRTEVWNTSTRVITHSNSTFPYLPSHSLSKVRCVSLRLTVLKYKFKYMFTCICSEVKLNFMSLTYLPRYIFSKTILMRTKQLLYFCWFVSSPLCYRSNM
jgi:hypothetical protein